MLAVADGEAEEEVLDPEVVVALAVELLDPEVVEALALDWALTRIGRIKAVKARENFMVVGKNVVEYGGVPGVIYGFGKHILFKLSQHRLALFRAAW